MTLNFRVHFCIRIYTLGDVYTLTHAPYVNVKVTMHIANTKPLPKQTLTRTYALRSPWVISELRSTISQISKLCGAVIVKLFNCKLSNITVSIIENVAIIDE